VNPLDDRKAAVTETTTPRPDAAWFDEARFGLFLHWGLYALPARHEWVQTREHLSAAHYERYREHFDPDRFDPRAWARQAKAAGFRYAVLTTKHHDGFCLWDSALTDFTSMHTPAGRDLVAEFVEAFRAEGLRIGFYHSLIDWHHPDFTVDGIHPLRNDPEALAANTDRDWGRYRDYLHGQVRELLTGYGTVDYLFFDFSYSQGIEGLPGKGAADWGSEELVSMIRELQPDILINDRLELPGDVTTPEQYQPVETPVDADGGPLRWEACQTLNGSWGYDRDNLDYKSPELLLRMLVDSVSKNGNMLLNIGPTARGTIDPRAVERPVHPARRPPLRARLRLAVRASAPAGTRRQGALRATPVGRLRGPVPGASTGARPAEPAHPAEGARCGHGDAASADRRTRHPHPRHRDLP
jgi:alpha-L-fucosidase